MAQDLFKIIVGADDVQAIVIESGLKREPIIQSYPRSLYLSKGFSRTPFYNSRSHYERRQTVEVVSIPKLFHNLCFLLNSLHELSLLDEDTYMSAITGYESFIQEALAFEEFSDLVNTPTLIKDGKKKAIFKRPKTPKRKGY